MVKKLKLKIKAIKDDFSFKKERLETESKDAHH